MAKSLDDLNNEITTLNTEETKALTDVLAAIKELSDKVATGQDYTTQVNNLVALEAPLQQLDAAAQAVIAPAPTNPAS